MIKLDGLSHTGFDVEDLDRCERFYVDVLGGKVEWKRDTGKTRLMKLSIGNLEVEAHYPTAEEALAVVEGRRAERKQDLDLYRGGESLEAHREGVLRPQNA
jgi:catechol 2,3-dioxygenase-like lactoylglutathione lyase family enzyme